MKQIMRILSLLMVLVLCVSLAPLSAFAEEEPEEILSGEDALAPIADDDAPDIMEPVEVEEEDETSAEETVETTEPEENVSGEETSEPEEAAPADFEESETESALDGAAETPIWPVPSSTKITQYYSSSHTAIDIGVAIGNNVVAVKSGSVMRISTGCTNVSRKYGTCKSKGYCNPNNGYNKDGYCNGGAGIGIYIKHDDGTVSGYAHLSSITSGLVVGSRVSQGTVIGKSGSSGNSSGPHLHFSYGNYVSSNFYASQFLNPLDYITVGSSGTTNPVAPTISGISVSGTSVTVSWGAVANATSYDVYLVQSPWGWDDIKYSGSTTNASYTFSNVAVGDYCAFVISRPNANTVQSGWSSFSVKPVVKVENSNYVSTVIGTPVKFTFEKHPSATGSWIGIYSCSTGARIFIENITSLDEVIYTFQAPGSYYIYVSCLYNELYYDSEAIYVDVGYSASVKVNETNSVQVEPGELLTLTFENHSCYEALWVGAYSCDTGARYFSESIIGIDNMTFSLDKPGNYYIYVSHLHDGTFYDSEAVYVLVNTPAYTITYDTNGGTGAPAAQTKTHDVALTLSSTKPTRAGYTFQGWATSSTATTAEYSAGGSYTVNASVTLYAVWKHDGDANGDDTVDSKDLVAYVKILSGEDSSKVTTTLDMNKDGVFDLIDLVNLMKYLVSNS